MSGKNSDKSVKNEVYAYIESRYKEEWSGNDVDYWSKFEDIYEGINMKHQGGTVVPNLVDEIVAEQSALRDLRYEIDMVPKSKQVRLEDDAEAMAQIERQVNDYYDSQYGYMAALEAFSQVARKAGVDKETIQADNSAAIQMATKMNNEEAISQLAEQLEEKAKNSPESIEYLVRGAPICCLHGSHIRHLDMHKTHGVYLKEKPLIHSKDCREENILSFGICSSPECTLTEEADYMRGAATDIKGNYLTAPDNQFMTGIKCKPTIVGVWRNIHNDTRIADNAVAGVKEPSRTTCYGAVTNQSYLLCKEGGFIMPLSSGQLDYSMYTSEFSNYPFNDIGSPAFERWCSKRNICPYYPGTDDYNNWYQEQIKRASTDEQKRDLYDRYLNNSYQYGLDNMSDKQQDRVQDMKEGYFNNGLLSEEEIAAKQEAYAGLRIDYGYNDHKNLAEATPTDPEFYQYYIKRGKYHKDQLTITADEVLKESGGYGPATDNFNAAVKERNEEYSRLQKELERSDYDLTEVEQAQLDEIHDLFFPKILN